MAAALGAMWFLPGPAVAQETYEMQVHFGQQIYRLFCVGCHGVDGRGNGDVAEALDMDVGDLTQIANNHDGVFPAGEVADAIAGLSNVSGHSRLAMEPWAEMFADEFQRFAAEAAVNELVARRIDHLVAYLQSIQE